MTGMTMKRRNFIWMANIAGIAGIIGCNDKNVEPNIEAKSPIVFKKYSFPLVISTWKNEKANDQAIKALAAGKSCIEALVEGIKVPESDENEQSVGYGGRPDREGNVSLDACIMDEKGNAGSVAYVTKYEHPIELAKLVMEKTPHVMLVGDGADQFAAEMGLPSKNLLTEKSRKEYEEWKKTSKYQPKANIERHDTIGMLCIDKNGTITGGCSTSGMAYKMAGRVGDSPIIGAGLFVDNEVGACTATGHGEYLLRFPGAILVVEYMRNGDDPQTACEKVVKRLIEKHKGHTDDYQIGLIAVNKKGEVGYYSVQKGFSVTINSSENQIYTDSKFEI